MKNSILTTAAALLLSTITTTASADSRLEPGAFVDLSIGSAYLDLDPIGVLEIGDSTHDGAAWKLNGGYWFSKHWGVAANYVELGEYEQKYDNGTFRGKAESYGLSVLGRLALGESWSLIGKVNVTKTEMDDNGSTGGGGNFNQLTGDDNTVVLPGVEVHYHFNDSGSVFLELDPRGDNAKNASHSYVGLGARWSF